MQKKEKKEKKANQCDLLSYVRLHGMFDVIKCNAGSFTVIFLKAKSLSPNASDNAMAVSSCLKTYILVFLPLNVSFLLFYYFLNNWGKGNM